MTRTILAALLLAACASSDPGPLMAEAWSHPRVYRPDEGFYVARVDGMCAQKVAWVQDRCGCGEMLVGWREINGRLEHHAALLHLGKVYDWDGVWSVEEYPMRVD